MELQDLGVDLEQEDDSAGLLVMTLDQDLNPGILE